MRCTGILARLLVSRLLVTRLLVSLLLVTRLLVSGLRISRLLVSGLLVSRLLVTGLRLAGWSGRRRVVHGLVRASLRILGILLLPRRIRHPGIFITR